MGSIGAELIGMIYMFSVSITCNSTQCKCDVAYSEQRYFLKLDFPFNSFNTVFLIAGLLYCSLTYLKKKFPSLKSNTLRS